MRAATGGPLGALLMIAPLVAIPVFAVVGIPQVAPVVSSAVGDEEIPESSVATVKFGTPAAAPSAAVPSDPDDLFAPVGVAARKPAARGTPSRTISPLAEPSTMRGDVTYASSPNRGAVRLAAARQPVEPVSEPSSETELEDPAFASRPAGLPKPAPRRIATPSSSATGSSSTGRSSRPAEALQGWALAGEEASADRTDPTDDATELPPPVPRRAPREAPVGELADFDLDEPHHGSDAPAPRKPHSAAPKRKRTAPADAGLNLLSVDESAGTQKSPMRRLSPRTQPSSAPRHEDLLETSASSPAPTGKISLAEFTPGLVHPAGYVSRSSVPRDPQESTTSLPMPSANEPVTWETATKRLRELGIRQYKLEALPGEGRFLFVCALTPANDPRISRQFRAVAEEPLLAVQKALGEIEEWQLHH